MILDSLLVLDKNEESRKIIIQILVKTGMENIAVGKNKPVDPGIFKKTYVNSYF